MRRAGRRKNDKRRIPSTCLKRMAEKKKNTEDPENLMPPWRPSEELTKYTAGTPLLPGAHESERTRLGLQRNMAAEESTRPCDTNWAEFRQRAKKKGNRVRTKKHQPKGSAQSYAREKQKDRSRRPKHNCMRRQAEKVDTAKTRPVEVCSIRKVCPRYRKKGHALEGKKTNEHGGGGKALAPTS